jgi:ADP-ribosyl-[dinitrogen reductase] hydrolase
MQDTQIIGSLVGTFVGDSVGLPYQGLSRQRIAQRLKKPRGQQWLEKIGMCSATSEQTCLVALALLNSAGCTMRFQKQLAASFKWLWLFWPMGLSWATWWATLSLWLGISPDRSGAFAAGNGPARRSAILGVVTEDLGQLRRLVRISTRLTHRNPKAEYGAMAIALAAHFAARHPTISGTLFLEELQSQLGSEAGQLLSLIHSVVRSVEDGDETCEFAISLGLRTATSSYIYHSVPLVIHAWLRHPQDFQTAVQAVVQCGGDTDSLAAMVGGIVGAAVGREGIPAPWLANLRYPVRFSLGKAKPTLPWLEELAQGLAFDRPPTLEIPHAYPRLDLILPNLLFSLILLYRNCQRLFLLQ